MSNVTLRPLFRVAVAALCIVSVPVFASAQRTFVASTGNDANPCSLVLPCRGFPAAIAAVSPVGEVIVLDSAGYGTFAVTKSVSVVAPEGVYAGVSVFAGGTGISIAVAATDVVSIRGLTLVGQGSALAGIASSDGTVLIERVKIQGMSIGISVPTSGKTIIRDSFLLRNFAGVGSGSGGPYELIVENTTIEDSTFGINVFGTANVTIDGVRLINSGQVPATKGIYFTVPPAHGPIQAHIVNSLIQGFEIGIGCEELVLGSIRVNIAGSELAYNTTAVRAQGGQMALRGNRLSHNTTVFVATGPDSTILTGGDNYVTFFTTLQSGAGTFGPPAGIY